MGELPRRVLPSAQRSSVALDGWSCRLLTYVLGDVDRLVECARGSGLPASAVDDLRHVLGQLGVAAGWWRDDAERRVVLFGSGFGTYPAEPDPSAASSSAAQVGSDEAADMIGRSARWVGRLIRDGELQAEMVGGRWLVDRDSVLAYLERRGAA